MWLTPSGKGADAPIEVQGDEFVLGRADESDLVVDDPKASRRHAALKQLPDGRAELRDLGTTNGTFVNERRIDAPVTLEGGETIRVGRTELKASKERPAAGAPTEMAPAEATAPAVPPPPSRPSVVQRSRSAIERIQLRRDVRRLTLVSTAAAALAAVAVILLVTGVFGGGDGKPSPEEIVDAVASSTVLVVANKEGKRAGNGTGWVLDAKQGFIVTNAHVVNGGPTFEVGVGEDKRDAKVVGVAPCEDLALLKVDDTRGLKTLPLGSTSNVKLGETVVAVGFPGTASEKDALTATTGVVSRVRTTFDLRAPDVPEYRDVTQTDTAINPGNSGGPLVDLDKRLVGVNSAGGKPGTENQNYAVTVDRVKQVMTVLTKGQSMGWAGLGFTYIDPQRLAQRGLPPGLLITHAVGGTPADQAGLGNAVSLLTRVNGKELDATLPSYCDAIGDVSKGGGRATLTVALSASRRATIDVPFK